MSTEVLPGTLTKTCDYKCWKPSQKAQLDISQSLHLYPCSFSSCLSPHLLPEMTSSKWLNVATILRACIHYQSSCIKNSDTEESSLFYLDHASHLNGRQTGQQSHQPGTRHLPSLGHRRKRRSGVAWC